MNGSAPASALGRHEHVGVGKYVLVPTVVAKLPVDIGYRVIIVRDAPGNDPVCRKRFPYAAFESGADDAMVAAVQLCSERHFLYRLDGLCRPAPSQKLQRFRFERVRRFKEFLQLLCRSRWQPPDVL